MCNICAALRPFDKSCSFSSSDTRSKYNAPDEFSDARAIAELPTATYSEIGRYLTNDYWRSVGEDPRAFDVPKDGLTVDLSGLDAKGAKLATLALEAWTDVSGIEFTEIEAAPLMSVTEAGDAGDDADMADKLNINATLFGNLGASDVDVYSVDLIAGESYTISLAGSGSGELVDPLLRILDEKGREIDSNDDAIGLDSQLEFTAKTSGTFFIQADRFFSDATGNYDLSITDQAPADITFDDEGEGGFADSVLDGRTILNSFVNIDKSWVSGDNAIGGYAFQVYMHEIGHALGLGHAGPYDVEGDFPDDAVFANDSWQATVMSYFPQDRNDDLDADYAFAATLMPADIIAIQSLYGTPHDIREGDTTYGISSNAGGYLGRLLRQATGSESRDGSFYNGDAIALTLFDTGGTDLIDVSRFSGDQVLDLNQEAASDVFGVRGNLVIARDTVIENASTGRGHDTIFGNEAANRIDTGAGDDQVFGDDGDDHIWGGQGSDSLGGGLGNDEIFGDAGDDFLYGDEGADRLDGGSGGDVFYGGDGNDMLIGGSGEDFSYGGDGNDRLWGNSGVDYLSGEDGMDILFGGNGNDLIYGDAGNDRLFGDFGTDSLFGGDGDDTIYGGVGADELDGDVGDDKLYGEDGRDTLRGGDGADFLSGGGSNDALYGGAGADDIWGNDGRDSLWGDEGDDRLQGGLGDDLLDGGVGADYLSGGHGNDKLTGGAGDDELRGNVGADQFIFGVNAGRDVVQDFRVGEDVLRIERDAFVGNYNASSLLEEFGDAQSDAFVIDFENGMSISLLGSFDEDKLAGDIVLV